MAGDPFEIPDVVELPWEPTEAAPLSEASKNEIAFVLLGQVGYALRVAREDARMNGMLQATLHAMKGSTMIFAVSDGKSIRVLDCQIVRECSVELPTQRK